MAVPLNDIAVLRGLFLGVEPAAISGYHINFLGDLPAVASAYVVTPINPVRIFAGVEI